MKNSLLVMLALILTACNLPKATTSAPVATPVPLTATLVSTITPTKAVLPIATAPTALPVDLFAANFITLPAPVCNGLTHEQTEGPYYKANTPERNILFATGMKIERLIVVGFVLNQQCQPFPNAWLDFWQADADGVYDNSGYTLRGHQFTDTQGRYFLETVVPGEYPGRTEHIHVKWQTPNGQIHTSQLYFPNVAGNASDGIYDPALIVMLEAREGYYVAYFNFVIAP